MLDTNDHFGTIICKIKMERPKEPSKEDCCNSGCNPCIFDIYEKQLALFMKLIQNEENNKNLVEENGISQLEYTKFVVVSNVNVCNSHNLITFRRLALDVKKVWWKPGDHFLFKYTSNEKSCTRAYTPVTINSEPKNICEFAIIVKKYNDGIVSSYLYNLEEGCVTLWRGPYGHYEIHPNKFSRIIMIAQGTGIAPFISIINTILNNEDDMTKLSLFYCCKNEDTIIFREQLLAFKAYWNFKYEIYLSSSFGNPKIKYQEPIKCKKFNLEDLFQLKPFSTTDQILICGSQQFNKTYETNIRKENLLAENIILF